MLATMTLNAAQQRAETALGDPGVRRLIARMANRVGKSSWAMQVARDAMLGKYECEYMALQQGLDPADACASNADVDCAICHGRAWCPLPAKVVAVSITQHQAADALQPFIEAFLLTLPEDAIVEKTTRQGLTFTIKLSNGSRFVVKTSKQGAPSLQGFGANLIIMDETVPRSVYRELSMRIPANRVMKLIFTFTPTEGRNWLWEEFETKSKPGVRIVTGAIFENGASPCQTCQKTAADWDPTLQAQSLARVSRYHHQLKALCGRCHAFGVEPRFDANWLADQEADWDDRELAMRFYGDFVAKEGTDLFTPAEQEALIHAARDPIQKEQGHLRWAPPCEQNHLDQWSAVPRNRYVMGVDCAEGQRYDESCLQILDAHTGEQAAMWADRVTPPEVYQEDIRITIHEFNDAYACIENDGKAGTVAITFLRRVPDVVGKLYTHRASDKRYAKPGAKLGMIPSGPKNYATWRQLVKAIRKTFFENSDGSVTILPGAEGGIYVYDRKTIDQLITLYIDDEGRIQTSTKHDDRAKGLALAEEARQDRYNLPEESADERNSFQEYLYQFAQSTQDSDPFELPALED